MSNVESAIKAVLTCPPVKQRRRDESQAVTPASSAPAVGEFDLSSHLALSATLLSGSPLRGPSVKSRLKQAADRLHAFQARVSTPKKVKAVRQATVPPPPPPRYISFTAEDLVPLLRLGALQGRSPAAMHQEQLPTELDMTGLDLRWVYDPHHRPSQDNAWRSLANDNFDSTVGVNSPRSVLAFLRRGVAMAELGEINEKIERQNASIEGLSLQATEARIAFLHERRANTWKKVVDEHARLRAVISRHSIVQFIDAFIADGCDYARLPALGDIDADARENGTTSPVRAVKMATDDKVADAMKGSLEKAAVEQQNLRIRAAMEIEARNRLAELAQRRALEAVAVARRREEAEEMRRRQRAEEAALRALISGERDAARSMARQQQEEKLEREHAQREARSKALDAAIEETKAVQSHVRQKRVAQKRSAREAKAAAADDAAMAVERRRLAKIAEAEAFSAELAKKKDEEQRQRREEARQRTIENQQRRQEVRSRAEAMLEEARLASEQRQREVEATLAEFKRQKDIEGQVARLRELKRELIREDIAQAAAQREADEIASRQLQGAAQQKRFLQFQRQVMKSRELAVERAKEEKMSKRDYVEQHERSDEFRRYATESRVAIKIVTALRVDEGRAAIVEQARDVRNAIQMEREERIKRAAADRVAMERKAYFDIYVSGTSPNRKVGDRATTPAFTGLPPSEVEQPPRPHSTSGVMRPTQLQQATPSRLPVASEGTPLPADHSVL